MHLTGIRVVANLASYGIRNGCANGWPPSTECTLMIQNVAPLCARVIDTLFLQGIRGCTI